ncbi:MAG: abortive infection system antitoxin AbiGi family protein [Bacteroidia bacterium]|nr:abortive infection system antitoxin AbiGi family protein [Bacteroidia bacterium]
MSLSTNSLIHFTKTKGSLIGILKDHFKIKYCLEKFKTPKGSFSAAIPMVSFCDIPLSEIKNHINNYGSYGIGLKKKWANQNELNPVIYIDTHSSLGSNLRFGFEHYLKGKMLNDFSEIDHCLMDTLRYIKNYEHDLNRKGKTIKNYRFSDEREWRYVPNKTECKSIALTPDFYSSQVQKDHFNNLISQLRLKFKPDDITYIIVKKETEISDIVKTLNDIKWENISVQEIDRLKTRIITSEQINTDF